MLPIDDKLQHAEPLLYDAKMGILFMLSDFNTFTFLILRERHSSSWTYIFRAIRDLLCEHGWKHHVYLKYKVF